MKTESAPAEEDGKKLICLFVPASGTGEGLICLPREAGWESVCNLRESVVKSWQSPEAEVEAKVKVIRLRRSH